MRLNIAIIIFIIIITIIDTDMVAILNSYVISKIFFCGMPRGEMQTTFNRGMGLAKKF